MAIRLIMFVLLTIFASAGFFKRYLSHLPSMVKRAEANRSDILPEWHVCLVPSTLKAPEPADL